MNKKTKKQEIGYKKIAIIALIVILAIILIVVIAKTSSKNNKELKLDEFEKIGIHGYLENEILDVSSLYKLSGNSQFDEVQVFQSQLKKALDQYFAQNTEKSVNTSTILEIIDSKYVPEFVDFHGVIVSGYEFNSENDTFVKTPGAHSEMSILETEVNNIDYSNKRTDIQKIEKESENKYKVTYNIIENMTPEHNIEHDSGTAIIELKDGQYILQSCEINSK